MEFKAVQIIIGVLAVLRINRNIMEFKVDYGLFPTLPHGFELIET